MFSSADKRSLILQRKMLCEEGSSASLRVSRFTSLVFLVLVNKCSHQSKGFSSILGVSSLGNRMCSTGEGQVNFLVPELVAGHRIVFAALVDKTVGHCGA